jgi:acetyl-CoA acetyltransferase
MVHSLVRTLVKILVASLIVGTILAHFGITADEIMKGVGLSAERISELAYKAIAWALPNMLLGALIIVPIWFLVFLFRPPGPRSND